MKKSNNKLKVKFLFVLLMLLTIQISFVTDAASVKKPSKVTDVNASIVGHTSVKISWKKQKATGYKVYRSTKQKSGYKLVKTTTSSSWKNTGLTPGKKYYYKVKAYNKSGKTTKTSAKYSSVVSATPQIGKTTELKVSSATYSSLKIKWDAAKYAKGYQIYRATSKNGKYSKIGTTTKTTYIDKRLTTKKTYYYKVRAYNKVGKKTYYGKFSPIISGKSTLPKFSGKRVSIMGDSISTFEGYIPKGNRKRYPDTGNAKCDVLCVEETWWHQLLEKWDAKLLVNDSWAGSTVTNTLNKDYKDKGPNRAMASMTRIKRLAKGNQKPEIILFHGGTNDTITGVKTGKFDSSKVPKTIKNSVVKWNTFADAYVAAIVRMQNTYPDAQIIVIIQNVDSAKKSVMIKICEYFKLPYVDVSKVKGSLLYDGIHPNKKGMDIMTNTIYQKLENMK